MKILFVLSVCKEKFRGTLERLEPPFDKTTD